MTIEFHCPYCTATVRVGDDASGKIGRCPKCETRLTVPTIPEQVNQQESSESAPIENAATSEQIISNDVSEIPSLPEVTAASPPEELGQFPILSVTEDPITSKYQKRRKKKPSNSMTLLPPVFFGGLLAIAGFLYYLQSLPSYEGTLEASRQNFNQSIQVELQGTSFKIDDEIFSQIADELRDHPSEVRSDLVNLSFRAGAEGLAISLRPGSEAELVKVPVAQLKPVAKYYQDHFNELNDHRIAEMQAGLISLSSDWVNAPEGEKNSTLPNYRNSVVYNAFVKGLGRICYANVGGAMYPCVHEDGDVALYFLIPTGTESFTIRERSELDETPFFPSKFLIQVKVARPSMADAELVPIESEPISEDEPNSSEEKTEDSEQEQKPEPEPEMST